MIFYLPLMSCNNIFHNRHALATSSIDVNRDHRESAPGNRNRGQQAKQRKASVKKPGKAVQFQAVLILWRLCHKRHLHLNFWHIGIGLDDFTSKNFLASKPPSPASPVSAQKQASGV